MFETGLRGMSSGLLHESLQIADDEHFLHDPCKSACLRQSTHLRFKAKVQQTQHPRTACGRKETLVSPAHWLCT